MRKFLDYHRWAENWFALRKIALNGGRRISLLCVTEVAVLICGGPQGPKAFAASAPRHRLISPLARAPCPVPVRCGPSGQRCLSMSHGQGQETREERRSPRLVRSFSRLVRAPFNRCTSRERDASWRKIWHIFLCIRWKTALNKKNKN